MKIAQFYLQDVLHYGVIEDEKIHYITAMPDMPATLQALFDGGDAAYEALKKNWRLAPVVSLKDVRLAPAVTEPGKIICIGLNYRAHAAEAGEKLPAFPEVFSKFNNALAANGDLVHVAPAAGQIDYEAELVAVIGKTCKNVDESTAAASVFGYTCGNDISAREQQLRVSQWFTGKSQDGFAPVGPWIVTADALDASALDIRMYRGENMCQNSNTEKMIFSVPFIVSYLSRYMTLCPGDIIFTGTPEGVILGTQDKNWLQPGETVTVEIEGIGRLTNYIGE